MLLRGEENFREREREGGRSGASRDEDLE